MKNKGIISSVLALAFTFSIFGSPGAASAVSMPKKQNIQRIIVLESNERTLTAKIDVVRTVFKYNNRGVHHQKPHTTGDMLSANKPSLRYKPPLYYKKIRPDNFMSGRVLFLKITLIAF